MPVGELLLLQPSEAAELPDDGPVEWAPLMPYWAVLWRSGVALGRELASAQPGGVRVDELGSGPGVPGVEAARARADGLPTGGSDEVHGLCARKARQNDGDGASS